MSTLAAPSLADADRAEFAAAFDGWCAVGGAAADRLGLVRERVGDLLVIGCAALPGVGLLNRVMGAGLASRPAADDLARAVALLHARGCTAQVPLRPDAPGAPEAAAWLREHGFAPGYAWMRFTGPSGVPVSPERPPDGLRVRECGPGDGSVFGATFAAGYGLPPGLAALVAGLPGRPGWTCLIAETADGAPVATGALRVHADIAWLGLGATLPAARGRGAQGLLLRERLRLAAGLGCRTVVSETGARAPGRPEASYRNLLRAGLAEAGLRPNWEAPPPA